MMSKDDGYGAPARNTQKGEPRFGSQCKDTSSAGKLGSGSTFGEPSGRMSSSGDLRSEPSFPNSGSPQELEGSRGRDSNAPTTGGPAAGASNRQWPEQRGEGYRSHGSGTEGS